MSSLEENKALIKTIQKHIFDMLCYIDDFCRENKITYYLSGGTCLGAVRHQGFIPWDDDADLMMPRDDYERFLRLFQAHSTRYGVGAISIDPKWNIKQAKIWDDSIRLQFTNVDLDTIGVFIDVFPIDGLPDNSSVRKAHYHITKALAALGSASVKKSFLPGEKYRMIKKIAKVLTKPIGPRRFYRIMDDMCKKYPFSSSAYVGVVMAAHYGERETIRREDMEKAVYLPFEGRELPVPVGYHHYLSNLYGDYMMIPKDAEENGYTHLNGWNIIVDDGADPQ